MHGGEHGVLVDARISSEEEVAALVVGLCRDGQHVALRDAELAALGLAEAALEVALVGAVDLTAIDGRGVDLWRSRAAILEGRDQPVQLHAARPLALGDLDSVGGAVEVINGGYRYNAVTWRRAVLSAVYTCVSTCVRGAVRRWCSRGLVASGGRWMQELCVGIVEDSGVA